MRPGAGRCGGCPSRFWHLTRGSLGKLGQTPVLVPQTSKIDRGTPVRDSVSWRLDDPVPSSQDDLRPGIIRPFRRRPLRPFGLEYRDRRPFGRLLHVRRNRTGWLLSRSGWLISQWRFCLFRRRCVREVAPPLQVGYRAGGPTPPSVVTEEGFSTRWRLRLTGSSAARRY